MLFIHNVHSVIEDHHAAKVKCFIRKNPVILLQTFQETELMAQVISLPQLIDLCKY